MGNGADNFEVRVVQESALLADAEESPGIDALVALDFGKLNNANANNTGRIFDDKRLARLVRADEAIDVNPVVGPLPEFAIEQAADGDDWDLRLFVGWGFENGDIAEACNKQGCRFEAATG